MATRAIIVGTMFKSNAYLLSRLPAQGRCLFISTRYASNHGHCPLTTSVTYNQHWQSLSKNQYNGKSCGSAVITQSVRWNSGSSATVNLSALPAGYIPEPPVPPVVGTEDLIGQLTALGEPTLQSLGLASWYPSGLVQYGLEAIHVGFDVPWWAAVVIGTVFLRLAVFPLVIYAQRNAANTHNHMPIFQKLQEKATKASRSGNPLEASRAYQELQEYMKKNKVNPLKNMLVPMTQMPIFISVFIGIRQMANLPVESMKVGGIAWFTDLTIADPYYALPLITMATFFVTLELGVDGVRAGSVSQNMRYFFRALPFLFFPLTVNFPAALLCYWTTSNFISLFQVFCLKLPGVRPFFKIPDLVVHDKSLTKKKPFLKNLKETWKSSKNAVDVNAMQKHEAVKFKEAGIGAVPKTYSYDPTKVKKKSSS